MREHANKPSTKRLYHSESKRLRAGGQLTIEKLKCYPGLETLSDADAAKAIEAITNLAIILLNLIDKKDALNGAVWDDDARK